MFSDLLIKTILTMTYIATMYLAYIIGYSNGIEWALKRLKIRLTPTIQGGLDDNNSKKGADKPTAPSALFKKREAKNE